MHIFPGLNYYNSDYEKFWDKQFEDRFLKIIDDYKEYVILSTGAHIHKMELRASISQVHPQLGFPQIASLSVTPVYNNNPSHSSFKIVSGSEKEMKN